MLGAEVPDYLPSTLTRGHQDEGTVVSSPSIIAWMRPAKGLSLPYPVILQARRLGLHFSLLD